MKSSPVAYFVGSETHRRTLPAIMRYGTCVNSYHTWQSLPHKDNYFNNILWTCIVCTTVVLMDYYLAVANSSLLGGFGLLRRHLNVTYLCRTLLVVVCNHMPRVNVVECVKCCTFSVAIFVVHCAGEILKLFRNRPIRQWPKRRRATGQLMGWRKSLTKLRTTPVRWFWVGRQIRPLCAK